MANEQTIASDSTGRPAAPTPADTMPSRFDLRDLETQGFVAKAIGRLLRDPQWLLATFRRVWPIPKIGQWAGVTRFADVQEVLARNDAFHVPWGERIKLLNGGTNFVLGMEAGEDYWRIQKQVMHAFRVEDMAEIVAPAAAKAAADIVASSGGTLDVIAGLCARVPVVVCERYYGVDVVTDDAETERTDFANWAIAMSSYIFGFSDDDPRGRRAGLAAAERMRPLIERSIARRKAVPGRTDVISRLLAMQANGAAALTDDTIRSFITSMIIGFIAPNSKAAGCVVEQLLRRPRALARTREAALADDDALLKRCWFEVSRFMPIWLGPYRKCVEDYTIAQGTPRARTIRKGMKVIAGTQSAMFDRRQMRKPYDFNPDRPAADYLHFGYGLHWCVGALIAETQITQTLKPLLVKERLRRAADDKGEIEWLGPAPMHLWVEFDPSPTASSPTATSPTAPSPTASGGQRR